MSCVQWPFGLHKYKKSPFHDVFSITDINECHQTGICNHGTCNNIYGDYICNCDPGYTGPNCTQGTHMYTQIYLKKWFKKMIVLFIQYTSITRWIRNLYICFQYSFQWWCHSVYNNENFKTRTLSRYSK